LAAWPRIDGWQSWFDRYDPMSTISLQELRQNPGLLLDRVEAEEEFVISNDGKPIAEVRSISPLPKGLRPYGLCAGEFVVPDDFDDPLPEDVLRGFEGR
jgi:prevent-host-death family protein